MDIHSAAGDGRRQGYVGGRSDGIAEGEERKWNDLLAMEDVWRSHACGGSQW